MPIGRRRSSAICPSSPAARASSAKPRSSSTGSPRSASAAPQTPAPLSGSRRPSTCSCTRPIASNSRRCGPRRPSSSAMPISTGVRGSPYLVHRVPEAGDEPPAPPGSPAPPRSASASQPASSVGRSPSVPLEDVVQVACRSPRSRRGTASRRRAARRPARPAASPAPTGRSSRAAIAVGVKPWSASATSTASKTRVSDGVGRRMRDQPEGELAEADLAHEVGGEVLAQQPDLVGGRGAERGREGQVRRRRSRGRSSPAGSASQRRISVAVLVEGRAAAAGSPPRWPRR